MKKISLLVLSLSSLLTFTAESFAATKYVTIGTGAITGVYYPAGGAVCRFLNRGRKEHNIRCSVESTGGSVSNLNAIHNNTASSRNSFNAIDFGIVQSDWQYHAFNGSGFFADQEPFKELRSVFSLYTETFTIAVMEKSDIKTLNDLLKKRVNFGPQGSGMYATMEVLMKAKGWEKKDFAAITYLQPSEQPKALCDGKIDVMIYASGNPNGVLQEATQTCKVRIISVDEETIAKLIKLNPYYVRAKINGGTYAGNTKDINTFGVKATVVTYAKNDNDAVYFMTKATFENLESLKLLHPVFASLKKEEMVKEGISTPIHPGALKYFKEAGLIK